jgi:hypothetical protein
MIDAEQKRKAKELKRSKTKLNEVKPLVNTTESLVRPPAELKKKNSELEDSASSLISKVSSIKDSEVSQDEIKKKDLEEDPLDPDKQVEPLKTVFTKLKQGGFFGLIAKIICNPVFSILRIVAIVWNAVTLGIIKHPQSESEAQIIRYSNIVLTIFFLVENVTLICGEGLKNFFSEVFNIVDMIIAIISMTGVLLRQCGAGHLPLLREVGIPWQPGPVHL